MSVDEIHVELTFHKDHIWIYNDEALPVVKYKLYGCKNNTGLDWDMLTSDKDGVMVEVIDEVGHFIFKVTDMGNQHLEITCDKIIMEEEPYDNTDLIDLIGEYRRQYDEGFEFNQKLKTQIESTVHFLKKEFDSNNRKIDQAKWLTPEKKQGMLEQNAIIEKALKYLI